MFFKKITSFSMDNSFDNFFKLFSSLPKPMQIYLILGNLAFKFLIDIKTLSWLFLFSSLATVIIFGKASLKIDFASVLNLSSITFGFGIPGKITFILEELIPTLIANSLVKFELAIMKFVLSVLLISLLFNDDPLSWLISFEWSRQIVLDLFKCSLFSNSKLFQWSANTSLIFEFSFIKLLTKLAFLYFLKSFMPFILSIFILDLLS